MRTMTDTCQKLLFVAIAYNFIGCSDYGFGHPDDNLVMDCLDRNYPAETVEMDPRCQQYEETSSLLNIIEWYKQDWAEEPQHNHVAMTPIALPLTDDNNDGFRDEKDFPDIVLISYQEDRSVIRAINGNDGSTIWNVSNTGAQKEGGLAGGDIDGDGLVEIIAVTIQNRVICLEDDGTLKWTSDVLGGSVPESHVYPAIANMDGAGLPEIIVGSAILDANGNLIGAGDYGIGGSGFGATSFAADLDQDGQQEVVVGNAIYTMSGDAIWYNGLPDGYPAVADLDRDQVPEIIVSSKGSLRVQSSVDGSVIWEADLAGTESGAPTIGDIDGDGYPEIGVASQNSYTVFEGDGALIWSNQTMEPSGISSAITFDFEGDGLPEILHIDQNRVWIFHGPSGAVKVESPEHSSPTWLEYAIVVDIDGDNEAEIVSPSAPENGSPDAPNKGITAFGAVEDNWRPGRTIWNQHAYSITNVNEDGTIPETPTPNWLSYNNFRSGDVNALTGLVLPDLYATYYEVCEFECDQDRLAVWVQVGNRGMADINGDVLIELWADESTGRVLLDSVIIDTGIPAGQALESIKMSATGVSAIEDLLVTVDGGNFVENDGMWRECDEENNEEIWGHGVCMP